jgi:hypothetical protein
MSDSPKLNKNFIAALYDFKLEHLVSLKFLKIIYFLFTISATAVAVFALFYSLRNSGALGLGLAFPITFIYFLVLIGFRIWIELVSSLLQISRNTRELVDISKHVAKNS